MASEATIVSEQFVSEITRRPFSLDKEFLVRWIIVENPDSHMLFVVGHHVAVDGQSMTILSNELMGQLTNSQEKLPAASDFSRMHAIEVSDITLWPSSRELQQQTNNLLEGLDQELQLRRKQRDHR